MHKFSLETPVEDMDEADLRSTLSEFMEDHEENVSDYEAVEATIDELGGNVHSIDQVACGDHLIEESETPQD